jgi:hypothetical protein
MNRFSRLLAAIALCALPAFTPESTAQATKWITVRGAGAMSCGQYIEYEKNSASDETNPIVQWTWGFLAAYNGRGLFNNDKGHLVTQVETPDAPSVLLYISQHCKAYPLTRVGEAVDALIHTSGGPIVWKPDKQ